MGKSPVLGARGKWLQLELQGKQQSLVVHHGVGGGWGMSALFTPCGNGTRHTVGASLRIVGRFVECTPRQSASQFGFVIVWTYLDKAAVLLTRQKWV